MTISSSQAAEFLAAHDQYLILTHVRPDGDTVRCRPVPRPPRPGQVRPCPAQSGAHPLFAPLSGGPPGPRRIFFRTRWSLWTSPPEPVPGQCPCPISPG